MARLKYGRRIVRKNGRWQELFLSYPILVYLSREHDYDIYDGLNSGDNNSGNGNVGGNGNGKDDNTSTSNGGANKTNNADFERDSFMAQICKSMAKHTYLSCNLAGLTWHVTAMMNELIQSSISVRRANMTMSANTNADTNANNANANKSPTSSEEISNAAAGLGNASLKIALVGKARVVCGSLNLYRILVHEALVRACECEREQMQKQKQKHTNRNGNETNENGHNCDVDDDDDDVPSNSNHVAELFVFQCRQAGPTSMHHNHSSQSQSSEENTTTNTCMASGLISSLLAFISASVESKEMQTLIYSTPELYDVAVFCLDLIVVLCSTQLYQPIVSSFQRLEYYDEHQTSPSNEQHEHEYEDGHFFLDLIMRDASQRQLCILSGKSYSNSNANSYTNRKRDGAYSWSPKGVLIACLYWMSNRPPPPERSIAHQFQEMAQIIAEEVKSEKVGLDGMYENHAIVMATAPSHTHPNSGDNDDELKLGDVKIHESGLKQAGIRYQRSSSSSASGIILDSTKMMIHMSSSLLLLPIKLLVVALRALGHSHNLLRSDKRNEHNLKLIQLQELYGNLRGIGIGEDLTPSPTNDVLWLSDSPLADLGASLFLLVSNNHRAGVLVDKSTDDYVNNPFRVELASMDDNRWDGYSDSTNDDGYLGGARDILQNVALSEGSGTNDGNGTLHHYRDPKQNNLLTTNFEHLFESFGGTLHSEVGALTLYTLLQASPIFAASLAVRSDLDKLVMPLLRTLYFSSSVTHHISGRTTIDKSGATVVEQPFRDRSQLYVIMILLLIFSQDASFGPDSFRRSKISNVQWYKERKLKDVSLGSLMILSLLRCITFNLNRLQDPFLLSNCCAVLLNLSPHAVELHSYTAMRLVSVLIATMKRYTLLVLKNSGRPAEDGDVSSVLGMYAEACRILLQIVKQGVRRKVVEKNLHLVYALVYNQRDFNVLLKAKCKWIDCFFLSMMLCQFAK